MLADEAVMSRDAAAEAGVDARPSACCVDCAKDTGETIPPAIARTIRVWRIANSILAGLPGDCAQRMQAVLAML